MVTVVIVDSVIVLAVVGHGTACGLRRRDLPTGQALFSVGRTTFIRHVGLGPAA